MGEAGILSRQGAEASGAGGLVLLSLSYLVLADFLFFMGWTTTLCTSLFLLGVAVMILIYVRGNIACNTPHPAADIWKKSELIAAILLLGAYFVIAGVVGWFPSHGDSWAFRQALYLNLKDAPWPVVLPNGREMSYYIAGMLPAAMVGRFLPESMHQWTVWGCIMIPLVLLLLLVFNLKKSRILLLLILLMGFQDPLRALFRPNATFGQGAGFMVEITQTVQALTGLDCSVLTTYYGNQTLMAPVYNCIGAYNSVPATLLATVLLIHLKQQSWLIPLVIALLVPISPLGAMACMPVAMYYFLPTIKAKSFPSLIVPFFIAGVSAVYFLRADSDMNVITAAWIARGPEFWIFYIRYLLGSSLLLLPLYRFRKSCGMYWVTVLSVVLLPCLFIGSTPQLPVIHGFNEFFLKGSIVFSLLIVIMWFEDWEKLHKYLRCGALAWSLLATLVYCIAQVKSYKNEHPVADMWNGHLAHQREFLNQSIPETKPPLIPGILLNYSGASEKQLPGKWLPKGKGVDYSRKPHSQAFP